MCQDKETLEESETMCVPLGEGVEEEGLDQSIQGTIQLREEGERRGRREEERWEKREYHTIQDHSTRYTSYADATHLSGGMLKKISKFFSSR